MARCGLGGPSPRALSRREINSQFIKIRAQSNALSQDHVGHPTDQSRW